MIVPSRVRSESRSARRDRPKSVRRGRPCSSIRTLAGFRSRWIDPLAVRVVERVGQVAGDPDGGLLVEALDVAAAGQRHPLDELVGDPAPAGVAAGVVDADDVRVLEPRRGPGLAEEPLHDPLARVGHLQDLQRHVAVEPRVIRLVDLAEPAVAEQLAELEPADRPERPLAPGLGPGGHLLGVPHRRRAPRGSRRRAASPGRPSAPSIVPPQTGQWIGAPVASPVSSTLLKQSLQTVRIGGFMVAASLTSLLA